MRFLAAPLLIVAMLAAARGGERVPLAVLSVAGPASIAADLDALGTSIDVEGLSAIVGGDLAGLAGVASLDGLDGTRRWGLALLADGPLIAPLAMVPVTDLDALLASAAPLLGDVARQPNGLVKIGRGEWTAYIALQDGWAFVAQTSDDLAKLPDAAMLLAPPRPSADLALTIYPRRLPEAYRTMAIDSLRAELRARAAVGSPPTAADAALGAVERLLTEVEHVDWTLSLDGEERRATVESRVLALPGSPLAATFAALGETLATAGGDDENAIAALTVYWPGAADAGWEQTLAALFPVAESRARTQAAIGEALREAVAGADAAACSIALQVWGGEPPTWVAFVELPDEKHAALLDERLRAAWAETPAGEPTPRMAHRGSRLALSQGPLAEQRLAAALDAPDRTGGGVDARLRLQPLLAALRPDDGELRPALATLSALLAGFDDRVALSVRGEGRELTSRLELPEGVLRLVAAATYFAAIGVPLGSP